MNLPFFIAKRYLISKKSHNAINVISGISVASICLISMALIVILSVFNGLSDLVKSLYNSVNADIEVTIKRGKVFHLNQTELQSLKKMKNIANYTEVMKGNALLKYNDKQCVVTIKGVEDSYENMTRFDSLVKEGLYNIDKNNIVIGEGIESSLNLGLNDVFALISIYVPKRGEIHTFDAEGGLNEMKGSVSATFSINEDFNKYVIMSIDNARKLFDYKDEMSSLEINVTKDADIENVQQQIKMLLGDNYEIKNREQQNALLYKTMKSEKLWTFIILVFILIIATFNVIASLTMLILEKKKDISILHHMGANSILIRKIFLFEGLLITLTGAVSGILLGAFICWMQINYSLVKLTEGYVINAYPVKMQASDFVMVLATVLLIGFIAAWYPVKVFTKKHLEAQ